MEKRQKSMCQKSVSIFVKFRDGLTFGDLLRLIPLADLKSDDVTQSHLRELAPTERRIIRFYRDCELKSAEPARY